MNSTIKMYDDGDHHHHRYHSESTFSTYHRHGKFPSSSLSSEQFGFNHRKSSSIRQQLQTSRDEKNTANNNIFNATKSSSIILTQSECKSSSSDQETNEHYQQNHYCDEFRNDHQDLIRSYHSSNNHCLRKSSNQYWRRNDSRISNHFDQRLTMKRFIRRPYVLLMILIMIALSSFDQYGIVVDAEKILYLYRINEESLNGHN
ncbi:hypothetical protein SSS_04337 [Sarcoptes scabiei]|uniref:Uncharacterized protein n=1 Tax=Sarcoptes scabiei TaxID=52283 RepID=A0A834RBK9_SARSC|nr:hypothetical protein SSS_04337 [Sarcoptes scabiei]